MLFSLIDLETQVAHWRDAHQKIVVTNGCFDLLHPGHVSYLAWAKAQGDILIVLLNSDQSVTRLKGPSRPILNEQDRATMLSALKSVDAVCVFDEDSPVKQLEALQPDIYVKAEQYTEETLPETPILKKLGTQIAFAPMQQGVSTTDIIQRISNSLNSSCSPSIS